MELSLEELSQEFARWRSQKRYSCERIPVSLLDAAVSLLSHHSQSEVIRHLRLDRKILRRHQRQRVDLSPVARSPGWVELRPSSPSPLPPLQCPGAVLSCQEFEVIAPGGHRLRVVAPSESGFAIPTLLHTFLKEDDVTSDRSA